MVRQLGRVLSVGRHPVVVDMLPALVVGGTVQGGIVLVGVDKRQLGEIL